MSIRPNFLAEAQARAQPQPQPQPESPTSPRPMMADRPPSYESSLPRELDSDRDRENALVSPKLARNAYSPNHINGADGSNRGNQAGDKRRSSFASSSTSLSDSGSMASTILTPGTTVVGEGDGYGQGYGKGYRGHRGYGNAHEAERVVQPAYASESHGPSQHAQLSQIPMYHIRDGKYAYKALRWHRRRCPAAGGGCCGGKRVQVGACWCTGVGGVGWGSEGAGGGNVEVPWWGIREGKYARKAVRWHRRRCQGGEGCWCSGMGEC